MNENQLFKMLSIFSHHEVLLTLLHSPFLCVKNELVIYKKKQVVLNLLCTVNATRRRLEINDFFENTSKKYVATSLLSASDVLNLVRTSHELYFYTYILIGSWGQIVQYISLMKAISRCFIPLKVIKQIWVQINASRMTRR